MDKHSTYYTVLDALKAAQECPLCALEADAMHGYFDAILYEAVNDPKVRAELVHSKGYCHRHAHYLTDMRDSFGIAILYQDQLQLFKDVLAKGVLVDSERTSDMNDKQPLCPACRNQLETRQRYLTILVEGLVMPEIKAAYEASPGFCLPHLEMLLEIIKDPSVQDPSIQKIVSEFETRKLAGLWDELQEFIRKHDYRYTDEPYGEERDSWVRAIKKLTGNRIVF
jgi:hypothetical protein